MAMMFSISGLRGVVGRKFTPHTIFQYAVMFGRYIKCGRVVIGRDTRASSPAFRDAVVHGLSAAGCEVIDLGIVPTPTVVFMVKSLKARGGLAITASHNPAHWNALKFISHKGRFFNQQEFLKFKHFTEQKEILRNINFPILPKVSSFNGMEQHINKIARHFRMKGKKNRLIVGVDAVNGAGSVALPDMLEAVGCKVYRINCAYSSDFPREPEPTVKNITGLCEFVRTRKLDLGFACDPDCDRLALVDNTGRAIGEDKTLVLITDFILSRKKGSVVTNLSTTTLMDFVCKKHKSRLYRTKVGEANVVGKMRRVKAVIGGEGNGGVIYPQLNQTRDALVAAALIVKLLNARKKKLSDIVKQYPVYFMLKKKIKGTQEHFEQKKARLIKCLSGKINTVDGLRVVHSDYWLHIRPSQTEPLIRIIGEGVSRKQVSNQIRTVEKLLVGD